MADDRASGLEPHSRHPLSHASSHSPSYPEDRDRRRDDRRERGRERSRHQSPSRSRSRSSSYERRRRDRQRRRKSGWDVPPTPEQLAAQAAAAAAANGTAGVSGIAPAISATASAVHPSRAAQVPIGPPQSLPLPASGLHPSTTRQARRLYTGNLPLPIREDELRALFNAAFPAAFPHTPPGEAVVSVYLNIEKKFGFVEFRTPEEATMALQLDGILLRGISLRVKRPSDYTPAMASMTAGFVPPPVNAAGVAPFMPQYHHQQQSQAQPYGQQSHYQQPGQLSNQVPDGPNKVFCGGLPYAFGEAEIKELLQSFGPLRAFHLVKDKETQSSKGYCFFEYADPSVTDDAVGGLNTLRIGDRTLTVRRAQPKDAMSQSHSQPPSLPQFNSHSRPPVMAVPTRVLVLSNMVTVEELVDDSEYRDILDEIQGELGKHGRLLSVLIPRPEPHSQQLVPGVGKVLLEFCDSSEAVRALQAVDGREFAGRVVRGEFMDVERYQRREF